jgi:hypothetical protein
MAAIALHFMHYNFARPHKPLANPYPRTPAMAAGVADHVRTMTEIAGLLAGPNRRYRQRCAQSPQANDQPIREYGLDSSQWLKKRSHTQRIGPFGGFVSSMQRKSPVAKT